MLKTTRSLDEPTPSKNNDSRLASGKNDGNGEVNKVGGDGVDHAKKSRKSKGQKTSKSQKLAKSQKLFKSRKSIGKKPKKQSKSGNFPNFGAAESGSSFLTSKARSAFNRLWLAYIEASILWHFDLECHIWIETDALGYAISGVLN